MDDQHSPQPTGSSKNLEVWTPPNPTSQGRADPRRSAWILAKTRQVLSGYRRDDFADPDGFLIQLGMVLERYADAVIDVVTNPISGIQRKRTSPPTIAHIVEFCDEEVERAERIRRLGELKRAPIEPRQLGQHRANTFVPADNARYQAMVDRARQSGTDPLDWRSDPHRRGIWVSLGWLDDEQIRKSTKGFRRLTGDELRALYGPNDATIEQKPTGN